MNIQINKHGCGNAVKIRPVLYETNTKSYNDKANKGEAWKYIAEGLGCNGNFKCAYVIVSVRAEPMLKAYGV
jgi:hypothetical protein